MFKTPNKISKVKQLVSLLKVADIMAITGGDVTEQARLSLMHIFSRMDEDWEVGESLVWWRHRRFPFFFFVCLCLFCWICDAVILVSFYKTFSQFIFSILIFLQLFLLFVRLFFFFPCLCFVSFEMPIFFLLRLISLTPSCWYYRLIFIVFSIHSFYSPISYCSFSSFVVPVFPLCNRRGGREGKWQLANET